VEPFTSIRIYNPKKDLNTLIGNVGCAYQQLCLFGDTMYTQYKNKLSGVLFIPVQGTQLIMKQTKHTF